MRVAICFDDLIQFGGAERLLLAVHELYPDAPVYTSVASDEWLKRCADLHIDLKISFMQKLPFKKSLNRFYGLLGLHALAFESFKFDDFNIVLSISARFAHGIITKPGAIHVCYMNSPGRMFWESHEYFCQEKYFQYENNSLWYLATPFLSLHRLCDYASAQRVDYFIANALTPKERIRKYYQRDSAVIYPFVDNLRLQQRTDTPVTSDSAAKRGPSENGGTVRKNDYYLVVTRLNAWKRVDIAIDACKKAGVNLKIIGEGPDKERLLRRDGWVEFLGYVSDQEKYRVIANCRALIVTQKEDFGITALEAMSLRKPVIAYRAGGALETVIEGVTGEFFDMQDANCLATTIQHFNASIYKPEACKNQAAKFSKQKFLHQLDEFVKKVYDEHHNL